MKKYITYNKINKILLLIKKEGITKEKFLDSEYKEVEKLGLIKNMQNTNLEITGIIEYSLTPEGDFFLNSYKGYRKIEYFFRDFPFFGAILIGVIGGILGGIVLEIIKYLK